MMTSKKFFKTVAGASLLIILFNVLSRFLGLFREIIFANNFGISQEFEIYLITAVFPTVINTILFYLGQNFFIPIYNKTKYESEEALSLIIHKSILFFTGSSVIITALLIIFSSHIINFYVQTEDPKLLELALNIFRILLITIPMTAIISILAAYQQAKYEFRIPIISQILLNIVFIAILILFSDIYSIYSITFAFVIATAVQLIFLFISAKEIFHSFNLKKLFSLREYSAISGSIFFMLLIEVLGQIYVVFDRYFYDSVNQGGFATLNYSTTIFLLPVAFISVSLSLALFPKISDSYFSNDKESFNKSVKDALLIVVYLFSGIAVAYIFYGDFIIRLIYERGLFTSGETTRTHELLQYLTFALVFYGMYSLIHKIYFVVERVKELFYFNILAISVKLVLNTILVVHFKEQGLAISSAISYILLFSTSIIYLIYKRIIRIDKTAFFEFLLIIANSVLSLSVTMIISKSLNLDFLPKSMPEIIIFAGIYLINSTLLKSRILFLFMDNYLPGKINRTNDLSGKDS